MLYLDDSGQRFRECVHTGCFIYFETLCAKAPRSEIIMQLSLAPLLAQPSLSRSVSLCL